MKKRTKILLIGLVVLLFGFGMAMVGIKSKSYTPSATAMTLARKATKTTAQYTYFKGDSDKTTIVCYPVPWLLRRVTVFGQRNWQSGAIRST